MYKAVHKSTGTVFEVIGQDETEELLKLKQVGTKIISTSDRRYYDIYNENGDFIDENGVIHSNQEEETEVEETEEDDEDKNLPFNEQVAKAYKHYIDSPFSDGYTRVYLESKFGMSIKEMKVIYNKTRQKKKLTDKQLIKEISEIVGDNNAWLDNDSVINRVRELLQDNKYLTR